MKASAFEVGDQVRYRNRAQPNPWPMQVTKVVGDLVTLNDFKTWHSSSLMLDSEWTGHPPLNLPVIEKGIPPPPVPKLDRRRKEHNNRSPSKWVTFLRGLEIGDSFLLEYPEANTLRVHARMLGINLRWKVTEPRNGPNGGCQERFWRVK